MSAISPFYLSIKRPRSLISYYSRVENLKDMVLYRFGSTGVNQCLSRAAELLGLVPIFPVRNIHNFSNGESAPTAVFRDCVLVGKYVTYRPSLFHLYIANIFNRNSTVGDVARKVMGDVPIAYVEGAGGTRVSEDDMVAVGKNDVSNTPESSLSSPPANWFNADFVLQGRTIDGNKPSQISCTRYIQCTAILSRKSLLYVQVKKIRNDSAGTTL